ncbi:MAG: hypothetical protein IJ783_11430 [Kiritimatiellae bacterium]|nr:hypothetical protein [Kiritimatiellia bacterium]
MRIVAAAAKPVPYKADNEVHNIVDGRFLVAFSDSGASGGGAQTVRPFVAAVLSGAAGRYGADGANANPDIWPFSGTEVASAALVGNSPCVSMGGVTFYAAPQLRPGHSATLSFRWKKYTGTAPSRGRLRVVALQTDTPGFHTLGSAT